MKAKATCSRTIWCAGFAVALILLFVQTVEAGVIYGFDGDVSSKPPHKRAKGTSQGKLPQWNSDPDVEQHEPDRIGEGRSASDLGLLKAAPGSGSFGGQSGAYQGKSSSGGAAAGGGAGGGSGSSGGGGRPQGSPPSDDPNDSDPEDEPQPGPGEFPASTENAAGNFSATEARTANRNGLIATRSPTSVSTTSETAATAGSSGAVSDGQPGVSISMPNSAVDGFGVGAGAASSSRLLNPALPLDWLNSYPWLTHVEGCAWQEDEPSQPPVVPEPSSVVMLMTGIGIAGWNQWRRRSRVS